jgi:hypothetical protein
LNNVFGEQRLKNDLSVWVNVDPVTDLLTASHKNIFERPTAMGSMRSGYVKSAFMAIFFWTNLKVLKSALPAGTNEKVGFAFALFCLFVCLARGRELL